MEVTVRADPGRYSFPVRLAAPGRQRLIAGSVLVVSLAAAALVWLSSANRTRPLERVLAHNRGAVGVAAAYGYPLGCLHITFLAGDRSYARADFNHRSPCGRYTGYPTVIFHYRSGSWRAMLDAIAYVCPVNWLPAAVQAGLGVC